jgi:uncharacterized membrane protein YeaQ/YmgE (transglycosylase-associated protein family)
MFSFMWWIIVGLIAGSLGKLFVPGRQPLGCLLTLGLGLVGSFVGGFISSVIWGPDPTEPGLHASGIILSTIGAVIVLAAYGAFQKRQRGGP